MAGVASQRGGGRRPSPRGGLLLTRIGGSAPARGARAGRACALRVSGAGVGGRERRRRLLCVCVWAASGHPRGERGAGSPPGDGDRAKFSSGAGRVEGRARHAAEAAVRTVKRAASGERDGSAPGARALPGPVPAVRAAGGPQHRAAHRRGRRRRRQDGYKEWSGESAGHSGRGPVGGGRLREGLGGRRVAPQLRTLPPASGNPRQAGHPTRISAEDLSPQGLSRDSKESRASAVPPGAAGPGAPRLPACAPPRRQCCGWPLG